MMKQLNAKGKGEAAYDFAHDILLFKIKDREYDFSVEFENIILDFDTKGFITGIQIFDASRIFGLPKTALRAIESFEFHSLVEKNIINVQLIFRSLLRNHAIVRQNIMRESTSNLQDSRVVATA